MGALEAEQDLYLDRMALEPGIARNDALRENVFVVVTCIFNRMPVFVVGKPGTSKTLTLQIVASNLLGRRAADPFWRSWQLHVVFNWAIFFLRDDVVSTAPQARGGPLLARAPGGLHVPLPGEF